jgi:type VI secretion system protein ImpC
VKIDFAPKNLKSFRPDGLCAEIPLLRSLLDGRQILDRVRDGSLTLDKAGAQLDRLWSGSPFAREVLGSLPTAAREPAGHAPIAGATTSASSPSGDASVDSLLDMVDLGGGAEVSDEKGAPAPAAATGSSALASIVARVAKSAGGGSKNPAEAVMRVERAIGAQIGAILQHPEVRRLERAYRGVSFVIERTKCRGLHLDVASAIPADAAKALLRASKSADDLPLSCAVCDVEVDGTAAGFALLSEIAEVAESYTFPVIVNGTAALFGEPDLDRVDKLDNKKALFDAPERAPWRSAAASLAMRWVTIAINGVLCRAGFDKTSSRIREAAVVEDPGGDEAMVWMSPAFAVGALIGKSFRDTGWPCRIVGPRDGGLLENLSVVEREIDLRTTAIPTRAFISTDTQRELSRLGVLALSAPHNSDTVILQSAPTAYVPPAKRTHDSATQEPEIRLDPVSLVDQLFVGRVAQFARALCAKIPESSDPAEVEPVVQAAIWTLFESAPPPGPEISVKARSHDRGTSVELTLRPRRFLGVALEELSMEVPLG